MGGPLKISSETIRARVYPLMREAVEVGVAYGWQRAHKHVDNPTPEAIKEAIVQAVMTEISERFSFSDDYE
jgi:hypothetical protein